MTEDTFGHLFDYGLPSVMLGLLIWGLVKLGRWLSGIIDNAVFNKETGWVAVNNRNSDNMSKFLDDTNKRNANQQHLCETHTDSLQKLIVGLDNHLAISKRIVEDLNLFRKDTVDHPENPFTTVETNKKLDRLSNNVQLAVCKACQAAREIVASDADPKMVEGIVVRNCDEIEELIKG